ncbi:MAG: hypothetical protein EBR82_65165 [Caulobacteraceae bacterium]|nr:hypothetical protein [Caulobacteraceae bacterium]
MTRPMIVLEFPDVSDLRNGFEALPKNLAARTQGAAVGRAIKPAVAALKRTTPVGPTGNLRRAVVLKTRRYPKAGVGVGMVGYIKPGSGKIPARGKRKDLSYHQFLVEYGTKPRVTKSGANRGRSTARLPVRMAWRSVEGTVKANLETELRVGLEGALKQLKNPTARKRYRS